MPLQPTAAGTIPGPPRLNRHVDMTSVVKYSEMLAWARYISALFSVIGQ
jgi:hypothetical protein